MAFKVTRASRNSARESNHAGTRGEEYLATTFVRPDRSKEREYRSRARHKITYLNLSLKPFRKWPTECLDSSVYRYVAVVLFTDEI